MNNQFNASDSTQDETLALQVSILVTSTLSFFSASCVVGKYLIHYSSSTSELALVAIMCFGDILQALSIEIPVLAYWNQTMPNNYSASASCQAQAFIQQLGLQVQFIWSSIIAYSAYKATRQESRSAYSARQKCNYIVGISYPLLASFIPLFFKSYGISDAQYLWSVCYISPESTKQDALLGLFFILPLILVIGFNMACFGKVLQYLQTQGISSWAICIQMMIYPLILVFCQIWFLIQILMQFGGVQDDYNFVIWCYITSNLGGLFDSLAYGMNMHYFDKSSNFCLRVDQHSEENRISYVEF